MTGTEVVEASRCPICGGSSVAAEGLAPLRRCAACAFAFLTADAAAAASYTDAYFSGYAGGDYRASEAQRRLESRRRLDVLACYAPPPGRIFEVGTAAGFFLDEARRRGYDTAGVELNDAMAAHARGMGLDVQSGRMEDAELQEGGFDAVCAFHVLEHVADPRAAVRRMRAALRPGGVLLLEVPNAESAVARRLGARWPALELPYHVGHHGPRSIRRLLELEGVDVVDVDTIPFAFYAAGGALTPAFRLARGVREIARGHGPARIGPHPGGHQLLRAVGRRPAA